MSSNVRQVMEQEILKLDKTFLDAILHNDATTVESILSDDFLSVFPDGSVANKATELENVRTVELESYSTDNVQIHWFTDDVAIVNFYLSLQMKNQNVKQVCDSHVYLKRDGQWQMIMGQTTPVLNR